MKKISASFFLSAALVLAVSTGAFAQSEQSSVSDNKPEVYIYYANFFIMRICCEVRYITQLLHLDGTNEWYSTDKRWSECLTKPPQSNKIYEALLPYLSRAKEGFFSGHVQIKIVNKTAGTDTYVGIDGGVYTFGDRMTRRMSHKDFNEVRNYMGKHGCQVRKQ